MTTPEPCPLPSIATMATAGPTASATSETVVGRHFYSQKIDPLFPSYVFLKRTWDADDDDDAFRKSIFETSKIRLTLIGGALISDEQMSAVNSTANELSMIQSRVRSGLKIKRGEVMRLIYSDLSGKRVVVKCDERNGRVKIDFVDHPGWPAVEVSARSEERV